MTMAYSNSSESSLPFILAALAVLVMLFWLLNVSLSHKQQQSKPLSPRELVELREKRAQTLAARAKKKTDMTLQNGMKEPPEKDRKEQHVKCPDEKSANAAAGPENRRLKEEQNVRRRDRRAETNPPTSLMTKQIQPESQTPESLTKEPPKKKKTKRPLLMPPPQVLCEALSQVFKCHVTVAKPNTFVSRGEETVGTWGGQGWNKRRRPTDYPNGPVVKLALFPHYSASRGDDWNALAQVFPSLLDERLAAQLLGGGNVRVAAACHFRASTLVRNGLSILSNSDDDDGLECLQVCLKALNLWIVQQVATWIRPEVIALRPDDSADATAQLANCLLNGMSDLSTCITFGVTGSTSSFYYLLVEELLQQDAAALDKIVGDVVDIFRSKLLKCESVLDGLVLVSAISALCLHKRAAEAVTKHPAFLLPAAGTTQADEVVRPPIPPGNVLQLIAGEHRPYKKRSGPALEKQTLLGAALRLGVPKNNAAFSPSITLNQSLNSDERANSQRRQQLRAHQEACCQMVLSLVKAGPDARSKVMRWFTDALLVNVTASAMRPDPSKVSSTNLLLNLSVVLLKLCDPFVDDERKMELIDAGFVSSPKDHCGVFATTGDDAVPRLGENADEEDGDATMSVAYNPKNIFIPQCFFLCARSLHLGIGPAEVALFQEEMVTDTCRFCNFMARVLLKMDDNVLRTMPEHFVSDLCGIILSIVRRKAKLLKNIELGYVFKLVVKLLSEEYASMVRNYNFRAMLGDILYYLYLPPDSGARRDVPNCVWTDSLAGGQPYLLTDATAQETLAPSLMLLYGDVEYTGYYDKMNHRAMIMSVIKYLWESSEHRSAFRRITQNKESFVTFANGIINETNALIATVMQKLPDIRSAQLQMKNTEEWVRLNEEERNQITSRLDDNEREVKHALLLCNKTVQMFSCLNTDAEIRKLFLMDGLCPRLVKMLLHVLVKLVGSKGLDLKVDNPEQYEFRPKVMLRDLCAIFALFSSCEVFQLECAKAGCDPMLLNSTVKTCRRLTLLTGESMKHFEELPGLVEKSLKIVAAEEDMLADAPDEFLDELMSTFMMDPVVLPSGHYVDRSTIMQHLLNDKIDPFSREPLSMEDVKPATELKKRMDEWLEEKRTANKSS